MCFRSDSLEEEVSLEGVVVVIDKESVPSERPRGPSPGPDIETSVVTRVDGDQVEEEISALFGMDDHRESYKDSL